MDKDGILYGDSFDVEVKLTNQSEDKEPRTVTDLDVSVDVMTYTGDECGQVIDKKFDNICLKYNEGEYEVMGILCMVDQSSNEIFVVISKFVR